MTLDRAVKAARTNPVIGLPKLAAVLTCKSGNYYVGYNSRQTHPLAKKFGRHEDAICLHAEVDAIRRACAAGDDCRGASLSVARVLRTGQTAMAKPCEGCQRAIISFQIKEVDWTTG